MYERGDLRNGVEGFGADGMEGLNNGLVYGVASRAHAPAAEYARHSRGSVPLYWTGGEARKDLVAREFNALNRARIPYLIEGDTTDASVMGTSAKDAVKSGVLKLGTTGHTQGVFMFDISEKFADEFSSGSIHPDFLNGAAWAIQNHQVSVIRTGVVSLVVNSTSGDQAMGYLLSRSACCEYRRTARTTVFIVTALTHRRLLSWSGGRGWGRCASHGLVVDGAQMAVQKHRPSHKVARIGAAAGLRAGLCLPAT